MPMEVSSDGQFCVLGNATDLTKVSIWAIGSLQCSSFQSATDRTIQAISWSNDGRYLAVGDQKGGIICLEVKTGEITAKFDGIFQESVQACTFFQDNNSALLCSVDVSSNLVVSNISKNVPKFRSWSADHFADIVPIKKLCRTSIEPNTNTNLIFLVGEKQIAIFNTSSGTTSSVLPFISLEPNSISASSYNNNLTLISDSHTLVRYSLSANKRKSSSNQEPSIKTSLKLQYKKRFPVKITHLSAAYENIVLATDSEGCLHIIKSESSSVVMKVVVGSKGEKKRKKKVSCVLGAACSFGGMVVMYGDSSNPVFEIFDIAEVIAGSKRGEIVFERDGKGEIEGAVGGRLGDDAIEAVVSSAHSWDVEQVGKLRKNKEDLKLWTIGDTLGERLEEGLMINSQPSTDPKNQQPAISISDKSTTLSQALHSNDLLSIKNILTESKSTPSIISDTLKNLSKDFLPSFFKYLSTSIKSTPSSAGIALDWLQAILKIHPSHILASAKKTEHGLLDIYNMSIARRKHADVLARLQGKLQFFYNEETANSENLGNQGKSSFVPEVVEMIPEIEYEADNDDSESNETGESDEEMDTTEIEDTDEEGMDEDDNEMDEIEIEPDFLSLEKSRSQKKHKVAAALQSLQTPENSESEIEEEEAGFYPME